MLKHYFRIAIRYLKRQKVQALLIYSISLLDWLVLLIALFTVVIQGRHNQSRKIFADRINILPYKSSQHEELH